MIDEVSDDVSHELRNLMQAVKSIDSYRRHNYGRQVLKRLPLMTDLELSRDRLSRVIDDLRGVK